MKTPVTHERLQNHLTYSWWKYVLMMVLVIFFWSILFTTTRYRPPEEKKVIVGVYGAGNQTALDAHGGRSPAAPARHGGNEHTQFIMSDETWGSSVLMTRMTARECDIYLLPKDLFQTYAQQGVFVALEETMPELVSELESRGISLSRGWRTDSDKHLWPASRVRICRIWTRSCIRLRIRTTRAFSAPMATKKMFRRSLTTSFAICSMSRRRRLRRKPLRNLIFCGGLQFVAGFRVCGRDRGAFRSPLDPFGCALPYFWGIGAEPTSSKPI